MARLAVAFLLIKSHPVGEVRVVERLRLLALRGRDNESRGRNCDRKSGRGNEMSPRHHPRSIPLLHQLLKQSNGWQLAHGSNPAAAINTIRPVHRSAALF